MRRHKQSVHGDEVFKCPQPGCQYSSPRKDHLVLHLEGFHRTAGLFACDHPGCTFRSSWREAVANHKRQVHSDERPFACDHTECSFSCKTKHHLARHQQQVHLKIKTKLCHVCDKRFCAKAGLRAHMFSQHPTQDHDMTECDNCVTHLMKSHGRSLTQRAFLAGAERTGSTQNRNVHGLDIGYDRSKDGGGDADAVAFDEVGSQTTDSLNEDLIDMHMDMQLLSLF